MGLQRFPHYQHLLSFAVYPIANAGHSLQFLGVATAAVLLLAKRNIVKKHRVVIYFLIDGHRLEGLIKTLANCKIILVLRSTK
jgi:hypothetical protein